MARVSRSRPLLCIDIAADTLHATFLPKGQGTPRVSGLLPATATPVEFAHGDLGWRVGDVAFARRLVDAHDAIEQVPGFVVRQAAESADASEAWVEGTLPFVDQAVARHASLALPMAHLLAHATRRALGEQEPSMPAEDAVEPTRDEHAEPLADDNAAIAADGEAHAAEQDADAKTEPLAVAEETGSPSESDPDAAEPAVSKEMEHSTPSGHATAMALQDADALLLVGGAVQAAGHQALADASQIAGLPAPSVMLRDQAIALATWRLAQAETHAERVREQMAHEASQASAPFVAPADNELPRTEAEEAHALHGTYQHEDGDKSSEDEGASSDASAVVDAAAANEATEAQTTPTDTGDAGADISEPSTPEASFVSRVLDAPSTWFHVALHADGLELCRVEATSDGPQVRQRARTPHASLQAVRGRAYAWACEAWDAQSDAGALDALAERRVIDGASNAFRRLAQPSDGAAAATSTRLTLPALSLSTSESADANEAQALIGLDLELSRKDVLAMLEPLLALAQGAMQELAPAAPATEQPSPPAKRRKTSKRPAIAADAPGLVLTGDIAAWPGLQEALAAHFSSARPLTAPSPEGTAQAARALLDGTHLHAA